MDILTEIKYLPPVQLFSKFLLFDRIIIDDGGFFEKQSYRNRCIIAGANGLLTLSIPVKDSRSRQPIKEVEIENSRPWQREHWHGIRSAYGKSPFFEYYSHYFQPFYEQEQNNLFQFDLALFRQCLKILKIPQERLVLLSEVSGDEENKYEDWRDAIHPKVKFNKEDPHFVAEPYLQVFSERHGFFANLSIIDLIFNEGPQAGEKMKKMVRY